MLERLLKRAFWPRTPMPRLALLLVLLAVAPAAAQSVVSGRITDGAGAPLPGVRVDLRTASNTDVAGAPAVYADADGRYAIAVTRTLPVRLRAVHLRNAVAQTLLGPIYHAEDGDRVMDFRFAPPSRQAFRPTVYRLPDDQPDLTGPGGRTVVGRAVDAATGRGIPGAEVWIREQTPGRPPAWRFFMERASLDSLDATHRTRTDAFGYFRHDGVAPGHPLEVLVVHASYDLESQNVPPGGVPVAVATSLYPLSRPRPSRDAHVRNVSGVVDEHGASLHRLPDNTGAQRLTTGGPEAVLVGTLTVGGEPAAGAFVVLPGSSQTVQTSETGFFLVNLLDPGDHPVYLRYGDHTALITLPLLEGVNPVDLDLDLGRR